MTEIGTTIRALKQICGRSFPFHSPSFSISARSTRAWRESGSGRIRQQRDTGTFVLMKIIKSAAIVALMSGCAIATIDVRPASAITFMDFIRGGKRRAAPEQVQPAQPLPGMNTIAPQRMEEVAKPPRVTGPRYYTYKAEPLRRIATDRLLDPVVTGSVRKYGLPPMVRAPVADALNSCRKSMCAPRPMSQRRWRAFTLRTVISFGFKAAT